MVLVAAQSVNPFADATNAPFSPPFARRVRRSMVALGNKNGLAGVVRMRGQISVPVGRTLAPSQPHQAQWGYVRHGRRA